MIVGMPRSHRFLRQQVLRRVRFATNALVLQDNRVPPEGPYDAALTNGLLAIVATDFPGDEVDAKGRTRPATALLDLLEANGNPLAYVDVLLLREALVQLTQPARHGRADDEFAVILPPHVGALLALDAHPSLRFLERAKGKSVDDCIWLAFVERAEEELPFDPKDRLDAVEPEMCDECQRPTFLPVGTDVFGGTLTAGECLACGYEQDEEEAYEMAVTNAILNAPD
jgi:hypothetical protein